MFGVGACATLMAEHLLGTYLAISARYAQPGTQKFITHDTATPSLREVILLVGVGRNAGNNY